VPLNHYRVKPTAVWRPEKSDAGAGVPQPPVADHRPAEDRQGPVVGVRSAPWRARPGAVRGLGGGGDVYDCADNGCGCGWEYEYRAGEPMGMRWPTPLIQITATSEDQTDNIYRPLQA
jgi:hypothetical protein